MTDWGAHHVDISQWGIGADDTGPVEIEGTAEHPNIPNGYNTAVEFNVKCRFKDDVELTIRHDTENGVTFVRFSLYATAQALQLVTMAVMIAIIARRGWFAPTAPIGLTRRGWVHSLIPAVTFAVSVPAFLLVGSWAFPLWAVLPAALERVATRSGVVAPE